MTFDIYQFQPGSRCSAPVTYLFALGLAFVLSLIAAPAHPDGQPPSLEFPARCSIGEDCWYMAFVDLDARDTYRDHMCGIRTYEAHKGTDIAPSDGSIGRIDVLASAAGRVVGTRDGTDDTPMTAPDPARDKARCGNGVRIDHGDGWTTQYCHMARGSVTVRTGDAVNAGDRLGTIGASGWSELPHLHMQLEKDGVPVDPFTGARASRVDECQVSRSGAGLWASPAANNIESYTPVHIRRVGLTSSVPEREVARHEGYPDEAGADAPALVAYVILFGAPAGAEVTFRIEGPAGENLHAHKETIDRDRANYFRYSGRKRPGARWPSGVYTARVTVSGTGPDGLYEISDSADLILR